MDIASRRMVSTFEDIFQESIFWGHQLAQARAGSLERPGHGKALLHQVADVLLEAELINFVVLKTAANENCARPSEKESQDWDVQVSAAKKMGHREVVIEENFRNDEAIDIRFMCPQQGRWIIANDVSNPL